MAALPRKETERFMRKHMPHQRCDVILVVEDGKEFKAHKQVLSEASPFFEKLLNIDMKESREGIVRLEMFTESAMRNTLQFIYTGDVQILAEDNARELVVSADYFFLPNLKPLAEGALVKMLNTSNCISLYYFSQSFQCKELLAKTEKCILANFTALYETNREEVLSMSSKEMEMWLSSDDINVSAEEEVFKIILAWIDHDKNKRRKYFVELFGHVRLVFASRDFLSSNILKNDLVKDNESCLNRVIDAINIIDSQDYGNVSISPRKSLETSVIVATGEVTTNFRSNCKLSNQPVLCYFPGEDAWCKLGEMPGVFSGKGEFFFYRGELPVYSKVLDSFQLTRPLVWYNPYSNSWYGESPDRDIKARVLRKILVVNDDEIYALVSERRAEGVTRYVRHVGRNKCVSSIIKYKVESNSWEDVTSFDHLGTRGNVCIVAKDNFVYFIGGEEWLGVWGVNEKHILYTDVYRYNLSRMQWDKVADILRPKMNLSGAASNGRIFITGTGTGVLAGCECEVYSETTNEWQSIASFNFSAGEYPKLLSVDDKLYALGHFVHRDSRARVECYDADKDRWVWKTDIPIQEGSFRSVNAYSARIFKGFPNKQQLKSMNSRRYFPPAWSKEASEGKCVIM